MAYQPVKFAGGGAFAATNAAQGRTGPALTKPAPMNPMKKMFPRRGAFGPSLGIRDPGGNAPTGGGYDGSGINPGGMYSGGRGLGSLAPTTVPGATPGSTVKTDPALMLRILAQKKGAMVPQDRIAGGRMDDVIKAIQMPGPTVSPLPPGQGQMPGAPVTPQDELRRRLLAAMQGASGSPMASPGVMRSNV